MRFCSIHKISRRKKNKNALEAKGGSKNIKEDVLVKFSTSMGLLNKQHT